MSRHLVSFLLSTLLAAILAPVVAEAQFIPVFHKLSADDDDVLSSVMGFPPSHPCPDPCEEFHVIGRIINCAFLDADGNCMNPNPQLTGGLFTDTPPAASLPLDCSRPVVVMGDGTWDAPTCDAATNTVRVENIAIDPGGTVEILFWSLIVCDSGSTINEARFEYDQNPNFGTPLRARDPASPFGGSGFAITVGEPVGFSATKDAPALPIVGMPPVRQAPLGSRASWVVETVNPLCEPVTLVQVADFVTPTDCHTVDCATIRIYIADIPTPLPPDTLCPDPSLPAAFSLGDIVLQPGQSLRIEFETDFTESAIAQCCNYVDFMSESGLGFQTSDPSLDSPLMPEQTCVTFGGTAAIGDAIKGAEDDMGNPITSVLPGDTIDWRFTLVNDGAADDMADLLDVFPDLAVLGPGAIILPFPTGTCTITGQTLECTDVVVPAGGRVEMVVRSTVDCSASPDEMICNQGTVTGMAGSNATRCPTCPAADGGSPTCVEVAAPSFGFASKVGSDESGDGAADVGERITWTINPLNDGTVDALNLVVEDAVPPDTSYVPGSLTLDGVALTDAADADAGEVVGGVVTVRVGDQGPVTGLGIVTFDTLVDVVLGPEICNEGASLTWSGVGTCPDGSVSLPTACVPTVLAPELTAVKAVSPTEPVMPGSVLSYSIEICNDPGAFPGTGLLVTDPIPTGTTYVPGSMSLDGMALTDAADGDEGELSAGPPPTLLVAVDDIAPGACRTVAFDVTVNPAASGFLRNRATVSADGVPAFETNRVSSEVGETDPTVLSALKSVSPTGSVPQGADLAYSVEVCNGPSAMRANGVVLEDLIPAGTTYVPGSMSLDGAPLTDVADLDAGLFDAGPPPLVRVMVGELAPGECKTVGFDVSVDADAAGTVTNTASVSSDETAAFNSNSVATPIDVPLPPDLSLVKSSVLLSAPPAMVGDSLAYTLTACNAPGAGPATGVVVSDRIPSDAATGCSVSYVAGSLSVGGVAQTDADDGDEGRFEAAPAPGQVVVELDDLAPGECVEITFEVLIEAGCDAGESITNVAVLDATGEPSVDSNSTSDVVGEAPTEPTMLRKEGFPLENRCPDPPVTCGCEVGPRLDPVADDCLVAGTCAVNDPTSWIFVGELTRSVDLVFYEIDGAGCRAAGDMEHLLVEKSGTDDVIVRLVP